MTEFFELLSVNFVQRALLAGILLAMIASFMGVITLIRKASFYGDTVAHASLAGIALGLALGFYPLLIALVYAIIIALMLPIIKERLSLSLDNILGIILPTSMGLGVIIFSLLPGYQPDMISFLFGSMVTISNMDLIVLIAITLIISILLMKVMPNVLSLSIDKEYAFIKGIKINKYERIFEVMLAVVIIAGVKLLGVILINALLIIPASAAQLFSKSLKEWFIYTLLISLLITTGGLFSSIIFAIPPGATIAVFSGIIFALFGIIKVIRH